MRRRLASILASVSFVLLGGAGPFDGCSAGDEPRPLPLDPAASCFFDEDCVPVGCEALRCRAGSCVEVAPIRDGDGDGHAPPPCGLDCDDSASDVSPDRTEICDLRDQDCDGRVDEGAEPRAVVFKLTTVDPTMAAVAWDDRVLVTDAEFTARGVRSRRLTLDGRLGTVSPLHDTTLVTVAADAAPTSDGAWVVLALSTDENAPATDLTLVRLRRAEDGGVVPDEETLVHQTGRVRSVALLTVDGVPFVVWDDFTAGRYAWSPGWSTDVMLGEGLVAGLGPLDVATDGTHLVVPREPGELGFLELEDGDLVGSVPLGAELIPGRPLESRDGSVLAVLRSTLGFASLVEVSTTALGAPIVLPGEGALHVAIDFVPEGLLVMRAEALGVGAWVLDPDDLSQVRRTYVASQVGRSPTILGSDVVSTRSGTAILTNFGEACSNLAVLACGEED